MFVDHRLIMALCVGVSAFIGIRRFLWLRQAWNVTNLANVRGGETDCGDGILPDRHRWRNDIGNMRSSLEIRKSYLKRWGFDTQVRLELPVPVEVAISIPSGQFLMITPKELRSECTPPSFEEKFYAWSQNKAFTASVLSPSVRQALLRMQASFRGCNFTFSPIEMSASIPALLSKSELVMFYDSVSELAAMCLTGANSHSIAGAAEDVSPAAVPAESSNCRHCNEGVGHLPLRICNCCHASYHDTCWDRLGMCSEHGCAGIVAEARRAA